MQTGCNSNGSGRVNGALDNHTGKDEEELEKPQDYYGAFITLGRAGILPLRFARSFAGIAGFRNILIHEYIQIDWSEVYRNLQKLDDLYKFAGSIKYWIKSTLAK